MTDQCCVLCKQPSLTFYHQDKQREYWQCQHCLLVQVPKSFHLTVEQEKAEYDKHDNQDDDAGYRRFLSRCLDPVLEMVSPQQQGLDFGCGEGRVLSKMAQEAGFAMSNYDLFYANDNSVLEQQYDFITATEVIEHIYDAQGTFELFDDRLKTGGMLALMTKRIKDVDAFSRWHYKNDPTHICFYSEYTFEWLANSYNWHFEFVANDVVLLFKSKP
ncbi:class I SAM-dependent methyltransferase [Shewanella sp. 202IG2-18]|uniref:class I SAM-dependent methyltransferase n=1 Tax=Parashewanella hymeniacidonis TaxID=2807618 RepID=UPI001961B74A|nr:class I SAM-dependent methyltransferase [Parashewanella hymeniacidonis]MBM7071716.1 class I SAM-dependent methyltransferase [Parashewanella hymeniacidonis]